MRVRDAMDQPFEAEASEVVGHLLGGVVGAEKSGHQPAKALVGEAGDGVDEHAEGAGQGHGAWVPEAQGSGSLALPYVGLVDALEATGYTGQIEISDSLEIVGPGAGLELAGQGVLSDLIAIASRA